MFSIGFLVVTGLLRTVGARGFSSRGLDPDESIAPILHSDFQKSNISAQWAQGHPAKWGTEAYQLQFNAPKPQDRFAGVVTPDQKYVAMFNGSHVAFVDVNTNERLATVAFKISATIAPMGLRVRLVGDGSGYDLLTGTLRDANSIIYRQRVSKDLKTVGDTIEYPPGAFGDLDGRGKMATWSGSIYDLDDDAYNNTNALKLKNAPKFSAMSFSSDGKFISTSGWQNISAPAQLWDTTTGESVFRFGNLPSETYTQIWDTAVSPDDKYVAFAASSNTGGYAMIYSLENIEAEPTILGPFRYSLREVSWSPDGQYLATPDLAKLQLWRFPGAELVQTWEVNTTNTNVSLPARIVWLDGGKVLSWTYGDDARWAYDFETNRKFFWTPGLDDHTWGSNGREISFMREKGIAITEDRDSTMRVWKI